jgi:hypothetical protein
MATRGRRGGPGGGGEDDRDRGDRERERHREYEREHEPPEASSEGRDRDVILDILARRWLGTAPPTAQAYARALAQWRRLPGAVVTAATDLGNIEQVSAPAGGTDKKTPS